MNSSAAIQALEKLKGEAQPGGPLAADVDSVRSWIARARIVLVRSLGENNHLVAQFDQVRWNRGFSWDPIPESEHVKARASGLSASCSYIDAAIFELGLSGDEADSIVGESFDAGLWSHVHQMVEGEDWANLASSVATYVEDRVRKWGSLPNSLVGKGLFARALGNEGPLRLGDQEGEWEGWRALGMGLAQAVGNVARHRIVNRSDNRAYALGVLGLGSLLLTQIRWEHEDLIVDVDAPRY